MGLFGGCGNGCNSGDSWIWVLIIIILVLCCCGDGNFLGGGCGCCDNNGCC
ncbi:MAG: hypothetical protein PUB42_01150 [Firmicutes bacterium]|nr:hypothetical protein [Bacillota bacterium]